MLLIALALGQAQAQQVSDSTKTTDIARWNVRFYPFAAITNLRAEVGYRFNERWEVNLLGSWYHSKIFWYRSAKSQLASPFYVPTQGAQVFLSFEQRRPKDLISIGARIGYRYLQSDPFEVTGEPEPQQGKRTAQINQQRTDFLCIVRVKSKHKGVFVEFIAQGGLAYIIQTDPYWWPALNVGLNIGFGW